MIMQKLSQIRKVTPGKSRFVNEAQVGTGFMPVLPTARKCGCSHEMRERHERRERY